MLANPAGRRGCIWPAGCLGQCTEALGSEVEYLWQRGGGMPASGMGKRRGIELKSHQVLVLGCSEPTVPRRKPPTSRQTGGDDRRPCGDQ